MIFFFFFAANFSQALFYINLATSAVPLVPFPFFWLRMLNVIYVLKSMSFAGLCL